MSEIDRDPNETVHIDGSSADSDRAGFHYSRERRLERAPESVRRAYEVGYTPNKGFLKGLTANAGLRSIFVAIVILCLSIFFMTFFGSPSGSGAIAGIPVRVKAFLYDGRVYVTCTLSASKREGGSPLPITVSVRGIDSDSAELVGEELSGVYSGEELVLRTTMEDYDIRSVTATFAQGEATSSVIVRVDRN